ncbi:hypothetical protein EVAR_35929_1 [Eumeta japonica]|uniref:Uncharacterized protein n=1 Tax=Eumeta variegata TaxID=151549 RepID=A0A4C1W573_EUMVA|nr:hypothetical protein EVAR_35929_1 [Eumeta japonica]
MDQWNENITSVEIDTKSVPNKTALSLAIWTNDSSSLCRGGSEGSQNYLIRPRQETKVPEIPKGISAPRPGGAGYICLGDGGSSLYPREAFKDEKMPIDASQKIAVAPDRPADVRFYGDGLRVGGRVCVMTRGC